MKNGNRRKIIGKQIRSMKEKESKRIDVSL